MDITCKEVVDSLADYLAGTLNPVQGQEIESHLTGCLPCVAFLKTYQMTIALYQKGRPAEPPAYLKERLLDRLRKEVRKAPLLEPVPIGASQVSNLSAHLDRLETLAKVSILPAMEPAVEDLSIGEISDAGFSLGK